MVELWVKKIDMGLAVLENVPDRYRDKVKAILDIRPKTNAPK